MHYILTAEEMRAADQAMFSEHLPSRAIMEVAGRAAAEFLLKRFPWASGVEVCVLCGTKNNGGDGLVLARALHQIGLSVKVLLLGSAESLSEDAAKAYSALCDAGVQASVHAAVQLDALCAQIPPNALLVDAIMGTGVKGALRSPLAEVIAGLNAYVSAHAISVFAIDVPTGLDASSALVQGEVLHADVTLALQALKICHSQLPALECCGEIYCADIGIRVDPPVARRRILLGSAALTDASAQVLNFNSALHKGSRGRVLVLGGSGRYPGAPLLSAQAASQSGAGIVELFVPEGLEHLFAAQSPQLIVAGLPMDAQGNFAGAASDRLAAALEQADAVVLGPGMGKNEGSVALLEFVLQNATARVVLDADALNILAEKRELLSLLSENTLLTPHPGEMSRLLKSETSVVQNDRFEALSKLRAQCKAWVLLKGAASILSAPDGSTSVSPFVNPSLATAGSGDVLSGCLAALASRGAGWEYAGPVALFAQGIAGEMLSEGPGGVFQANATAVLDRLPMALTVVREEIRAYAQRGNRHGFVQKIYPPQRMIRTAIDA